MREGKSKIIYNQKENSLEIIFPGHRKTIEIVMGILTTMVGIFLLVMGTRAMLSADVVFKAGIAFTVLWVVIVFVIIILNFRLVLWQFYNKEIHTLTAETWQIDRQGNLLKDIKKYPISEIKNLRIREEKPADFWKRNSQLYWNHINPGSTLRFDYQLHTIKFGSGISEAEALQFIHKLLELQLITNDNIWRPLEGELPAPFSVNGE